ncbi:MAG TPA: hypothetical protein VKZ96_12025 [Thermomicrobiales bacterium]|nr:hypothetical protein [Thermomicrobiales bacterium]
MSQSATGELSPRERAALGAALDALLPPTGSFPLPSETDMIDAFILAQLPPEDPAPPYPGIDRAGLRQILAHLDGRPDMTAALRELEADEPEQFQALWALAVFGYYSRPEVTAAIQRDLAPGYNGAPLPKGYAHVIAPWDAGDPLQMPRRPVGRYIPTDEVRRVDLSQVIGEGR